MLVKTWTPLASTTIQAVPSSEGVYVLADASQAVIYIGQSLNLRRRLQEHVSTSDSCLRQAEYFSFELTRDSVQRERELLEEFRRANGRYPRCNDR